MTDQPKRGSQPPTPMPNFKVWIMGASLGTGNRGVSALGASLAKLLFDAIPNADIGMLIGSRRSEPFEIVINGQKRRIPIVSYRMSPKSPPKQHLAWISSMALLYRVLPIKWLRRRIAENNAWISAVVRADLIGDIRGGDSFSDIYGVRGFVFASLPVITVIWVRGSIVLFPQTYGPFRSPISRFLARYILRRAAVILSRDKESIETVRELVGPRENLYFCPDVAFALDSKPPSDAAIEPPWPKERPGCIIGLNINGLMYNGGYNRRNMFGLELNYHDFLKRLVVSILGNQANQILLVPHTYAPPTDVESDPDACLAVRQNAPEAIRHRIHLVAKEYDQFEIKGVIGGCDFFIGSRMHSCIAALSQGIPTIGVAYSKKFKGVFDSIGVRDWIIDARSTGTEAAVDIVANGIEKREQMRSRLAEKPAQARAVLRESFGRFLNHGHFGVANGVAPIAKPEN